MKVLPVDVDELEFALEHGDGGLDIMATWLDVKTGDLLQYNGGFDEQDRLRAKLEGNKERYIRIETVSPDERYKTMEKFVRSLPPSGIREKLERALRSRKPRFEFNAALTEDNNINERWFKFNQKALSAHAISWLASLGIQAINTPYVAPKDEDDEDDEDYKDVI